MNLLEARNVIEREFKTLFSIQVIKEHVEEYIPKYIINKIKQKFGATKLLGSEENGNAYLIKSGKVMKLTSDEAEVNLARKLKGKKLIHYADIYDILKIDIPNPDDEAFDELRYPFCYIIFLEYLKPLSEKEINWFIKMDYFSVNLFKKSVDYKAFKNFELQLSNLEKELRPYKVEDISSGNLGYKKNGNLAAFDLVNFSGTVNPDNIKTIVLK